MTDDEPYTEMSLRVGHLLEVAPIVAKDEGDPDAAPRGALVSLGCHDGSTYQFALAAPTCRTLIAKMLLAMAWHGDPVAEGILDALKELDEENWYLHDDE